MTRVADFALHASRSPEVQSVFGLDCNHVRNHFVLPDLTAIESENTLNFWT